MGWIYLIVYLAGRAVCENKCVLWQSIDTKKPHLFGEAETSIKIPFK